MSFLLPGQRGLADATRRKIAQDIRHMEELLASREHWAKSHPASDMRAETFREINWWKGLLEHGKTELERG